MRRRLESTAPRDNRHHALEKESRLGHGCSRQPTHHICANIQSHFHYSIRDGIQRTRREHILYSWHERTITSGCCSHKYNGACSIHNAHVIVYRLACQHSPLVDRSSDRIISLLLPLTINHIPQHSSTCSPASR